MSNLKNRKGQGLVEYILIVFLMAIGCLMAFHKLSDTTQDGFKNASTKLEKEFK